MKIGGGEQQKILDLSEFDPKKFSTLSSKILLLNIYAGEGEMKWDEVRLFPPGSSNEDKSRNSELER